jgi:DNA modification methylase
LQADGWWLRSDIIWHKPNPMPESVTDRPTKSHEHLFLLAKSERYYYDAATIGEPQPIGAGFNAGNKRGLSMTTGTGGNRNDAGRGGAEIQTNYRNKRDVWSIPTTPFPGAHFATFPPELIKPCILAGSPEGGVVLDPFLGSGTTAMVAKSLGRRAVGIDLNAEYLEMAKRRCAQMALELAPTDEGRRK